MLALTISGCGFKVCDPCGGPPEKYAPVHVAETRPSSELRLLLEERLRSGGFVVVDSPGLARGVITLESERFDRSILSLNIDGDVLEFELNYSVTWGFQGLNEDPGGQSEANPQQAVWRVPPRTIRANRAHRFNSNNILANEAEVEVLKQDMRAGLAAAIYRQLGLLADNQPNAETVEQP